MDANLEIIPMEAMRDAAGRIEVSYPFVRFSLQGATDMQAVGWFTGTRPASAEVMVAIGHTGYVEILSGDGYVKSLYYTGRPAAEVAELLCRELEPIARYGIELVRLFPWMRRISPSWVGHGNSEELVRAKRRFRARTVRKLSGWT